MSGFERYVYIIIILFETYRSTFGDKIVEQKSTRHSTGITNRLGRSLRVQGSQTTRTPRVFKHKDNWAKDFSRVNMESDALP